MYKFLRSEWSASVEAVQGFEFNQKDGLMQTKDENIELHNTSTAATTPLIPSDPLICSNGWLVMKSNVGMSWKQFQHFLLQHENRFQAMKDEMAKKGEAIDCIDSIDRFPIDVIEFSLAEIRRVRSAMQRDGISELIQQIEPDHESNTRTDEQHRAGDVDGNSDDDVITTLPATDSDDSEEDWKPRRRLRRKKKIVSDDEDEEDANDNNSNTVAGVSSAISATGGTSVDPLSHELCGLSVSNLTDVHELPTRPTIVEEMIAHSTLPTDRATNKSIAAANLPSHATPHPPLTIARLDEIEGKGDADSVDSPFTSSDPTYAPKQTIRTILKLIFQDMQPLLHLPFLSNDILTIVASYAVPPIDGVTSTPSKSSSSTESVLPLSSSSSTVALSSTRGPFFVVVTHYANGDTFSEEFATDRQLLNGILEYLHSSRQRLEEVRYDEESEAQWMDCMQLIDQIHSQVNAYRIVSQTKASLPMSSSPSQTASQSKLNDDSYATFQANTRRHELDELLQSALTLGDEMITNQFGYGWTHVHECNETN